MSQRPYTNRLINASSPYLLQHAHNPVDWWEWSDEAFKKARREDKLILVSIGYSACHWCHVMERECFEKEDTAAIMNEHFICIKVDREERPDIDQVYMDAVQLLTGQGGWPLNCFVLPDGRPIHGGTYFPKAEWERTLKALSDFYTNKKEEALAFAADLTEGVRKLEPLSALPSENLLSMTLLGDIIGKWRSTFDHEFGGFNRAPKFPMPNNWELFLQSAHYTGDNTLSADVHHTLSKMAQGGIFDQVGGGFARYSTDAFWKVPHFEKMLYDNAQLIGLYADAYSENRDELYRKTVELTHSFIRQMLTSPEGLFYSALDADSEGVEGKYYTWTRGELQQLLGPDEPVYSLYYSVDAYGNWEHGQNILYRTRTDQDLERLTGQRKEDLALLISKCNDILLQARQERISPGLDDKVITTWNALMISGYVKAYESFDQPAYLEAAEKCAHALIEKLWNGHTLHRIFKNGKVSIPGFAEDYASFAQGLLDLFEATANNSYLHHALQIVEAAITQFYDKERNLFYFKSNNDQPLFIRKTDLHDDVIPSANSIFAKVLFRLSFYLGRTDFYEMTENMIAAVQSKLVQYPTGYSNWMQLILWKQHGFRQVLIAGSEAQRFKKEFNSHYLPGAAVIAYAEPSEVPLLKDKPPAKDTKIYICRDRTCGLPLSDPAEAIRQLTGEQG